MSIFHEISRFGFQYRPNSGTKQAFILNFVGKSAEELFPVFYEFSGLVFNSLDIRMDGNEVVHAWTPFRERFKPERLNLVLKKYRESALITCFDYVELISLQSGIFALEDTERKVLPKHLTRALEWIKCRYKVEGLCD
jgi:hypothetical protein